MRILLTGGGSAGHINPALAIAETVKQNCPDAQILFVGTERGKEKELVEREGYNLEYVQSEGFQRALKLSNFKALYLLLFSPFLKETTKILDDFQPDMVIGTGGYVCWPIMAAAARRGIPTALHESNAKPGLAVQLLQRKAKRIWINFEETKNYLHTKCPVSHVGNPLRCAFSSLSREEARRRLGIEEGEFFILSFGGSLGAEPINEAVLKLMKEIAPENPRVRFLHASGKRDAQMSKRLFEELKLGDFSNCTLTEYIYDMPMQMAAADLIVSRAGAMTLSELALMKKAAILIPSPYVAANHQFYNAKALADAGAAILVEESALKDGGLTCAVRELLNDNKKIKSLETQIERFAKADANREIWMQIREITER